MTDVTPHITEFEGGNALLVSYRYIGTSARDDNALYSSRTSLDIHALDFDYRGCTHQPLPSFTWFWQAGKVTCTTRFFPPPRTRPACATG